MTEPTDTNQASEDEQAMQHICQQTGEHYYASESIPGGLIHWIRICMTCGHKDDKDLNEQVKTLIRTEKLKLLDEVVHQSTVNLRSAKAVAGWAELRKEQLEAEL